MFRSLSITRKLSCIVMLATAVALGIALVEFSVNALVTQKVSMRHYLETLADVIASNSQAALSFSDPIGAKNTLRTLHVDPLIIAADIFDSEGRPFAGYRPGSDPAVTTPDHDRPDIVFGKGLLDRQMSSRKPIVLEGEVIGSIVIRRDLSDMWSSFYSQGLILGACILFAFVIAILLVRRLHRAITAPIFQLVQATRDISETRSYSIRVVKNNDDELGVLIEGFNNMLEQIAIRDRQLEQHGANLEREIEARTSELVKAKDMAEQASLVKSQFLATMSHEIRTPLNGVLGMAELLLNTRISAEQRRWLDTLRSSAKTLLAIINDILDFSKIEAGKLELENMDFSPSEVAEDVAALLAERAHAKQLELLVTVGEGVPSAVRGDPHRLRQILINLVGNAVKFTESGEVVVVLTRILPPESIRPGATWLQFMVRDTGIGLCEEAKSRLFQPFTQADGSTTRRYGGTGLGLAISQQLVELMGGEIGMESRPGKGSTFCFSVPFDMAEDPQKLQVPCLEDLKQVKALIVDDNRTSLGILQHFAAEWGMQGTGVTDGTAALEVLRQAAACGSPYQLALIDVDMPDMDGTTLGRLIKADPQIASTRLVMLTSTKGAGDTYLARQMGFAECLSKPVRCKDLYACLSRVMAGGHARQPDDEPPEERRCIAADVLLAEDNVVNQEVATGLLESLGCQVTTAADGRQAIEALAGKRFDLVFMDCMMPEMDGFEATDAIRAREAREGLPRTTIVALTANAIVGDREKCIEAGMDDYLAKPFTREQLRGVLTRWVGSLPMREKGAGSDGQTSPADLQEGFRESTGEAYGAPATCSPREEEFDPKPLQAISALQRTCGSDLLHRILRLYLETTPNLIQELRAHIEANDLAGSQRTAHSLKSSHAQLGLNGLAQLCRSIELGARSGTLDGAAGVLAEIEARLPEARRRLQQEIDGADDPD